jgi:hypothetical protein
MIHTDPSQVTETCPFEFNFNPATFKVGDVVSYRVPERFGDMPFVGSLVEVSDDGVTIVPYGHTQPRMPGTRARRPEVSAQAALG